MPTDRTTRVCVVGTGHIGLPLAAVLAEAGFPVTGYDTNQEFIEQVLLTGRADFREEGLDELLARHLTRSLVLSSTPPSGHDIYIITVGTPLDPGTNRPNLARVQEAIRQIGPGFSDDPLIVLRSTVTVGTTRHVVLPEIARHVDRFGLAFCPERTIEGKAIPEMTSLPQIIGGLDAGSTRRADALFLTITRSTVHVTSLEAAEMIKLINNTYRDITFAFANEIALIAERLGLSAPEMIRAANLEYPRSSVPQPGFVGGPCLEKDALILMESLRSIDFSPRVVASARAINGALPDYVADRLLEGLRGLGRPVPGAKVLVTGFAFKGRPATEDVRGSAAIPLMRRLQAEGVDVWGHDFVTPERVIAKLGARSCSLMEGFDSADAVIVMNNHPAYLEIDVATLTRTMRTPGLLFDSWNLLSPERLSNLRGLHYASLGTPSRPL